MYSKFCFFDDTKKKPMTFCFAYDEEHAKRIFSDWKELYCPSVYASDDFIIKRVALSDSDGAFEIVASQDEGYSLL